MDEEVEHDLCQQLDRMEGALERIERMNESLLALISVFFCLSIAVGATCIAYYGEHQKSDVSGLIGIGTWIVINAFTVFLFLRRLKGNMAGLTQMIMGSKYGILIMLFIAMALIWHNEVVNSVVGWMRL